MTPTERDSLGLIGHKWTILVCPRCGTIVTSKGDEGNYCEMHFPERVEPEVVEVVSSANASGAVDLLRRVLAGSVIRDETESGEPILLDLNTTPPYQVVRLDHLFGGQS